MAACAGLTIAGPDTKTGADREKSDARPQLNTTSGDLSTSINNALDRRTDRVVVPVAPAAGVRGAPANDNCSGAIDINANINGAPVVGSTVGATSDIGGEVCWDTLGTGVWFTFTGTGNTMVIDSCSVNTLLDTRFTLYCGTGCGDLVCVTGFAENDDSFNCTLGPINSFSSELVLESVMGQQYFLLVHESVFTPGDTDAFEINISDDGVPAANAIACGAPAANVPCPGDADYVSVEPPVFDGYDEASSVNGGCVAGSIPPGMTEPAECGWTICGTMGVYFAPGSFPATDLDFYTLTLTEPQDVTVTMTAEFNGRIQIFSDCISTGIQSPISPIGGSTSITVARPAGDTLIVFRSAPPAEYNIPTHSVYVATIACAAPSGPPNDFANDCEPLAAPTMGMPTVVAGTTTGASAVEGAPLFGTCVTTQTVPGVWYCLTGNGTVVTATTCEFFGAGNGDADYDTKISVFRDLGGTWSINPCVTGNDDAPGCGLLSAVTFCAEDGVDYLIHVHGFGAAQGDFTLELSSMDEACACLGTITPQMDDVLEGEPVCFDGYVDTFNPGCGGNGAGFFLAEIPSDLLQWPFGFYGEMGNFLGGTGAQTREFDAFIIDISPFGLNIPAFTMDFTFEAEFSAQVVLTTSDCFIAAGNNVIIPACTPTNLSFSAGLANSTAGDGLFYLIVTTSGFNTTECGSPYRIEFNNFMELTAPANDLCADAIAVSVDSVTSGTTIGATIDTVPDQFCGTSITAPGVWYSLSTTVSQEITVSTCDGTTGGSANFDTKISVFCNTCADLLCIGGNDDACVGGSSGLLSTVTFCAEANGEYLILVHGFGAAAGAFDLAVVGGGACSPTPCAPPTAPANDLCEDAIALTIGGSVSGDTTLATVQTPTISDCMPAGQFPGPVVSRGTWYLLVGNGNDIILSTCNTASYDTAISVYCDGCDMLTCVGGNDDGVGCAGFTSEFVLPTQNGAEYLVHMHGFAAGSFGAYTLNVTDTGMASVDPQDCGGMDPGPAGCNPADLNEATAFSPAAPTWGMPDGVLTPADFVAFVNFFNSNDLRADLSEATAFSPASPTFGMPDGLLTPADFVAFVAYFNAGCPCTLPGCP
jgi:hypothetical protein